MNNDVQHFWELLIAMTERELRSRYKYTIFGFFWLVANPLLQMVIIYFVFTFFMKEPIQQYPFYLFIGLLVWNFFSLSLTKTTPSILYQRQIVKKAAFSQLVIPLSIILANALHFTVALIMFLGIVSYTMHPSLIGLSSVGAGMILLYTFTSGISFITTSLNVRFRDVNFFVQALLLLWFYATPIFYTLTTIPHEYLLFWNINPMTSIVGLFQYGFLRTALPPPGVLFGHSMVSLLTLLLGIYLFKRESKNFDDWL